MDERIASDLMIVALELRLAAHDPSFTKRRLTDQRLLELADIVDDALSRLKHQTTSRDVAALAALRRRAT